MLRITDILDVTADCRETWTLRLEGTLKDEWVRELRRAWRRIREAAAGASIRVELADVPFVDPAGKVLLAEMYRDGVDIVAPGCRAAAGRALRLRRRLVLRPRARRRAGRDAGDRQHGARAPRGDGRERDAARDRDRVAAAADRPGHQH